MKNILILSALVYITDSTFAQSCDFLIPKEEHLCPKSKERLYVVPNQGILRHIGCPRNKGGDMFILSDNTESVYGCLLSSAYDLGKKKMKVHRVGPNFFLIKTSEALYKYDFKLRTWTTLRKMDPGSSTGNREDP